MPNRYQVNGRPDNPNNGNGAILFGVLIIVLTISLIGASLAAFLFSLHLSGQYELSQAKALYLAEAGISHAVHLLRSRAQTVGPEEYFIPPTQLGEGTYEVKHDFAQSLITSIGKVEKVKRKIQLKYNAF